MIDDGFEPDIIGRVQVNCQVGISGVGHQVTVENLFDFKTLFQ